METKYESRFAQLSAKPNLSPKEQAVKAALTDLDEKTESKAAPEVIEAAKKAVADAEAQA